MCVFMGVYMCVYVSFSVYECLCFLTEHKHALLDRACSWWFSSGSPVSHIDGRSSTLFITMRVMAQSHRPIRAYTGYGDLLHPEKVDLSYRLADCLRPPPATLAGRDMYSCRGRKIELFNLSLAVVHAIWPRSRSQ